MNKMVLLGKRLLVDIIRNDSMSSVITVSQNNFLKGKIIKVGNGYSAQTEKYDVDFNEGEIVVFSERSAQQYNYEGKRYLLVNCEDVIIKELIWRNF